MNATVNRTDTLRHGRVFDVTLENITLSNGTSLDMEIIRHPGAAAILPLSDQNDVLMLRQYRHAAGEALWEIPAGTREKGEETMDCARRELAEETGYAAGRWEPLGCVLPVPGYSDEKIDLYLARDLRPARQDLDADEMLEVHAIPINTVLSMIDRGVINDAKTVTAVFRASLRLGLVSDWP